MNYKKWTRHKKKLRHRRKQTLTHIAAVFDEKLKDS